MASDSLTPSTPDGVTARPDPGLPPVQPPSGRMMVQLFLVPGLIVAGLVVLFLVLPRLARWADSRTAAAFLRDLDSDNPDVRYRAASDLSQLLPRKDELASDPDFALALADRLQATLKRMAGPEKEYATLAARPGASTGEGALAAEGQKLAADRNLSTFLAASLGSCMVPVGVPLLEEMAGQTVDMEDEALAERRRRALFALANLGENLKRFDKLSDEKKAEIEQRLEAAAARDGQSARARPALEHLRQRRAGKPDMMGLAGVLKKCAGDDDPALREYAAFASNFWAGTTEDDRVVEGYLKALAEDKGQGEDRLARRTAGNPNAVARRPVTKRPGFGVQANATVALARRGSPATRLEVLAEMLDPAALAKVFVVRARDGSEVPDEGMVGQTVLNALKATALLAAKRPEMRAKLSAAVGRQVEALTQDGRQQLSEQAAATRRALAGEG